MAVGLVYVASLVTVGFDRDTRRGYALQVSRAAAAVPLRARLRQRQADDERRSRRAAVFDRQRAVIASAIAVSTSSRKQSLFTSARPVPQPASRRASHAVFFQKTRRRCGTLRASRMCMGTILQDVRYATRMLRKAPGASAVAIVSLAIGIGINTTVFGWIRNVLFDPLPGVADHHRIVTVETVAPSGTLIDSSYPDYQAWRDHATLLSGVIAFKERPVGVGVAGRGDDANAERAWAMLVSGNYFDVLGVRPALGRFFEGDEQRDTFDAHPVAVLAHAMWRRRFNADPAVVGRTIALNRRPYTVIGVAPDGFHGTITGLQFDLFVPLTMQASLTGGGQWLANGHARALYLFARLTPGATIEQARDEVRALAAARARERPDVNRDISATLLPLDEARRGSQHELGPLLKILMAVGALLLLIVCANVANLQLARAAARRREIGVRLGLGATRRRLGAAAADRGDRARRGRRRARRAPERVARRHAALLPAVHRVSARAADDHRRARDRVRGGGLGRRERVDSRSCRRCARRRRASWRR